MKKSLLVQTTEIEIPTIYNSERPYIMLLPILFLINFNSPATFEEDNLMMAYTNSLVTIIELYNTIIILYCNT